MLLSTIERMKPMPQPSSSSELSAPVWLREQVYQPKRQRTINLVRQSIDALREAQARISLASIAARSRELDPDGIGVSESTILANEEARSYYEQYRSWKHQRRPPTSKQKPSLRQEPGTIKLTATRCALASGINGSPKGGWLIGSSRQSEVLPSGNTGFCFIKMMSSPGDC